MIVITLVVCMVYGGIRLSDNKNPPGSQLSRVPWINTHTYASAIGYSVYCYEGIGVIMPVQDITMNPEQYNTIVYAVIASVAIIYVIFG